MPNEPKLNSSATKPKNSGREIIKAAPPHWPKKVSLQSAIPLRFFACVIGDASGRSLRHKKTGDRKWFAIQHSGVKDGVH